MPKVKPGKHKRVKNKIAEQVTKRPVGYTAIGTPLKYTATATRDGKYWLVKINEIDTAGQAKHIWEIRPVAREVIGLWLDADPDTIDVDVLIEYSDDSAEERQDEEVETLDRVDGVVFYDPVDTSDEDDMIDETAPELVSVHDHQVHEFLGGLREQLLRNLPERFEAWGNSSIIDQNTGFVAPFESVSARDSVLVATSGLTDGQSTVVDGLDWVHIETGSRVFVNSESELNRYFLLSHEEAGLAILDCYTQTVVPLDEDTAPSAADGILDALNDPEDDATRTAMFIGAEFATDWVRTDGAIPERESDSELKSEEPVPPPVRVLVISSSSWSWRSLVEEQLRALVSSSGLDGRPVTIITSGSPNGAEAGARALAEANGWATETIRDEGIPHSAIDYGFAYVTDYSTGAEAALETALASRIPMHVTRETPAIRHDPWAGR